MIIFQLPINLDFAYKLISYALNHFLSHITYTLRFIYRPINTSPYTYFYRIILLFLLALLIFLITFSHDQDILNVLLLFRKVSTCKILIQCRTDNLPRTKTDRKDTVRILEISFSIYLLRPYKSYRNSI